MWIQSAPAFSTADNSLPRQVKSADNMEGAICAMIGLLWFNQVLKKAYHNGYFANNQLFL
jgi:hypothetical protein